MVNVLWNVLFYIVMDSVSPFITIGDFCVYKRWGYLISFKCAQIDQIIFSVSGSNQSVTFTQIIIFQVHNNYQKEVNGFKLSLETYYLRCQEPYNLVQSSKTYILFWPVMLVALFDVCLRWTLMLTFQTCHERVLSPTLVTKLVSPTSIWLI